jgi:hypothetical protein
MVSLALLETAVAVQRETANLDILRVETILAFCMP